jgi:hypothetical protein
MEEEKWESSYEKAMKCAGATVNVFEQFGSYQGEWYAKVTYKGITGWINGSYGSCSGCDAFESEFGYEHHNHIDNDYYDPIYDGFIDGCEECQKVKTRFISFGEQYLDEILTQDAAEKKSQEYSWDGSSDEMLKFIKDNA